MAPSRGTSAPSRKVVAGKVKVAKAWVHVAEFQKAVASRLTAEPTGTSNKRGGGDRQAKGQDDLIKKIVGGRCWYGSGGVSDVFTFILVWKLFFPFKIMADIM